MSATQYLNCQASDVLNFNDVLQVTFTEEQSSFLPESLREYNFSYQMQDLASTYADENLGGLLPLSPFTVPSGAVSLAVNFVNPSSTPVMIGNAVQAINAQLDYYTDVFSVKKLALADATAVTAATDLIAAAGSGAQGAQGTGVLSEIGSGVSSAASATGGFLSTLETPVFLLLGAVALFAVWEASRKAKYL